MPYVYLIYFIYTPIYLYMPNISISTHILPYIPCIHLGIWLTDWLEYLTTWEAIPSKLYIYLIHIYIYPTYTSYTDMQKVCFLPRPKFGFSRNFRKIAWFVTGKILEKSKIYATFQKKLSWFRPFWNNSWYISAVNMKISGQS